MSLYCENSDIIKMICMISHKKLGYRREVLICEGYELSVEMGPEWQVGSAS
jgi:hypothetical protein